MALFGNTIWDSSVWARASGSGGAPIQELYARLGGVGVAVDPLDGGTVYTSTDAAALAAQGGTVARIDSSAGVSASFTNGTAAWRPILRADGLEFDGVDDFLITPDIPELRFGLTNFTVAIAVRPDTVQGNCQVWSKRGSGAAGTVPGWDVFVSSSNLRISFDAPGNPLNPAPHIASGVFSAGVWEYALVEFNRTANTATARVGGVDFSPVEIASGDISGALPLTIGQNADGPVNLFDGTIGRLLAIDKLLSPEDTALVEQWLQNLI